MGRGARRLWREMLAFALVLAGALVAGMPAVLDLLSDASHEGQISRMEDACSTEGDRNIEEAWRQARAYNCALAGRKAPAGVKGIRPYAEQLLLETSTCISSVEVPSIGVRLPVYHGTGKEALAQGAGHVEGTALPVGGKGTNCCISAHSGLSSSCMFDGLREVARGDWVFLRTLGRTLAYRVSGSKVVDDEETAVLEPEAGVDKVTLVTCTSDPLPGMPGGGYGVNDRRLVVTAVRCTPPRQGPAPRAAVQGNGRGVLAGIGIVAACAAVTACVMGRRRRKGIENE